jgi:hypothetical protein
MYIVHEGTIDNILNHLFNDIVIPSSYFIRDVGATVGVVTLGQQMSGRRRQRIIVDSDIADCM